MYEIQFSQKSLGRYDCASLRLDLITSTYDEVQLCEQKLNVGPSFIDHSRYPFKWRLVQGNLQKHGFVIVHQLKYLKLHPDAIYLPQSAKAGTGVLFQPNRSIDNLLLKQHVAKHLSGVLVHTALTPAHGHVYWLFNANHRPRTSTYVGQDHLVYWANGQSGVCPLSSAILARFRKNGSVPAQVTRYLMRHLEGE